MSLKFDNYTGYEQDDESSIEDDTSCESEGENDFENEFGNYLKSTKKTEAKEKKPKSFEDEMNDELDKFVRVQEEKYFNELNGVMNGKQEEESDTDSEAEFATGVRTKKKREHFTNDELFYDPNADEMDQKWINKQRITNSKKIISTEQSESVLKSEQVSEKPGSSNPNSDAVLNCPCCMSLVCMDCQRHEKYRTQFRAMFVFNCSIKQDEQLKYPKEKSKKKKKADDISIDRIERFDIYKPVECKICKTEIGVFDPNDEMYHFFNVLASHS
ncbi:E2F-associated phospho [Brachionus plicatilis]|uniref:E2F-associated phospho n=1 Tax=Brachionus plicatilis TaxID=10195 RepID=A0A3M7RQM8_BRAPC|nr:E2F-associated phospho [Brachionus plicatilis]